MWRPTSLALLVAFLLTSCLEAQRSGPGFRSFAKVNGHSSQVGQRAFSSSQFRVHFHHRDGHGLGAFWSPYFLPDDGSYWGGESGPEPIRAEPTPEVVYAPPERERPPAEAQLIEIPGAADRIEGKPPLPAIFVLINGERVETQRFALTLTSLSVDIDRRERVIPLDAVDLSATTAANRDRGINLRIPVDRNEISVSF
jgi:hypothetical protein